MATSFRLINSPAKRGCSLCGETHFDLNCLPCSHNICTDCLQNTRRATSPTKSVHCPIDENKFPLPNNGIDSLPVKGHLVEVSSNGGHQNFDRLPAKISSNHSEMSEMYELLTFTQEYRNDLAAAIRDMQHGIDASLALQEDRVKEEIRRKADALVDLVRAKEQDLYQEVDRVIAAEKRDRQQEIADFSLQAHHVIQVVEMNHGKFKPGRRDELLANQVQAQLLAVKERKSALTKNQDCRLYEISFVANDGCFKEPLGRLECKTGIKGVDNDNIKGNNQDGPVTRRRSSSRGEQKRKQGHVLSVIFPPSPLSDKFRPWSLSISESGHIAVVDRGNNCIHIFNPKGDFLRHVAKPYGSKSLEVYGVTFVSRNTFAVAEYSPSTGSGCLLEMGISGEHLRVIANLKGPAHVTSFTSYLNSCQSIIAVYYTNSFEAPDVFVGRDERKVELPMGSSKRMGLSHPQKGVFLKDKFIFSDSNEVANQGCVKVFDSNGQFTNCFGEQPLWNEESLGHPLRIAADPLNCALLVYQQFTNRMRVYDVTGACVSEFPTTSGLLDFTVAPDGRLVATCSKNSEFPNSVVILSYM